MNLLLCRVSWIRLRLYMKSPAITTAKASQKSTAIFAMERFFWGVFS
jgi:hypothetical protein